MTRLNRYISAACGLVLLTSFATGCAHNYPYAPRVAEEIPAQVCSGNGDSDRDGITDCNDLCANSPPGRPVGPDGCTLPEPPMEPKPFRG